MYSGKDVFRKKLIAFCNYRERCQKEFIDKMWELKIPREWQDELILEFIQENILNEERFARALVRGKFRINAWGKTKIRMLLKSHGITEPLLSMALQEIDEDEYLNAAVRLYRKKFAELKGGFTYENKNKCRNYLQQRGFDHDIILQAEAGMHSEDGALEE